MKLNFSLNTFKDKRILLPREEVAWETHNKIFKIKLGFWKWDIIIGFNF